MSSGYCEICNDGKLYNNLGSHQRQCKDKQEKAAKKAEEQAQKEAAKEIDQANKKLKAEAKEAKKTPLIINPPDPAFRPDEKATEQEKLKRFLEDLPIWSGYQEHSFLNWRAIQRAIINPGEPMKDIVFVSDDRPPRVLHLPYDPEKNRLFIPGKGYYMTNIKGDFMIVHEDYMLPIINAPNLKDRFMIPAHVVAYAYSSGLAEGKAQSWDKMIAALQGIKYLAYAAAGVAIIAIIAYILSSYEMSGKINLMAAALNNATAQATQQPDIVIK